VRRRTSREGLVLLEVIVALVVLTLVGLGGLELVHQSHVLVENANEWSEGIAYAEDAMELAKLGAPLRGPPGDLLPGGFRRQITRRRLATSDGLEQVTVTIFLPDGRRFGLDRLARITNDESEQW
jgi:hypothetical protein